MRTPSISKKSKVESRKSKVFSPHSAFRNPQSAFRIPHSPHSAFRNPRSQGFTLLELLIVIALIMVLMGLLIPAFSKVRNKAKEKKAEIEATIIGSAIRAYKLQEKKFPAPDADLSADEDRKYGYGCDDDNGLVMETLTNTAPAVLDYRKLRWSSGNAINPWDKQYRITLDLDYDGKIDGNYAEYKVEWNFQE